MDELKQCNEIVGNNEGRKLTGNESSYISLRSSMERNKTRASQYFPFKQGYLSVMTLRLGEEGIQMTVDGKHITSFAFREVINFTCFSVNAVYAYVFMLPNSSAIFVMISESGAVACK